MLKVVTYPHSALVTKCTDVTNFDNDLESLLLKMFSIMKKEGGIGLAANQVAITKRIFIMELENKQYIFINPIIISKSTNIISYNEGCLSFPNIQQENQRSGQNFQENQKTVLPDPQDENLDHEQNQNRLIQDFLYALLHLARF